MKVIQQSGEEYARASVMTLFPSILIMVLLGVSCLPVWAVCGCCENCCCKKRKEHEGVCLPCVIWIIWLVVFVLLIILIIAAQFSFKQFSEGVSQSVCDVDGSLGAISNWFTSLATVVETLGTEISGFVGDGKTAVFKSVDSLEPTIDSINTTLSSVLKEVMGSTAIITAAFAEFELENDIDLQIGELNKQLKNLNNGDANYKSIIQDSKKQVGGIVSDMQTQIQQFPASITTMLKNASTSVSDMRRDLFNTGSINLDAIPVLLDNGLKQATLLDAVAAGTESIQTLVVLIYTPVFIALPALFIGGMAIIAAFVKCRENKAAATFGLCCSKCGCFLIWMGLFVTLGTSLIFLTMTQVYNDSCSVFADPIYVIDHAKKNNPQMFAQLTAAIPKNNFTQNFNDEVAIATVKQCLAGSSYSGPSLAKTMGLDLGVVDGLLDQASSAIDSGDGINLGGVDTFIDKSSSEINNFKTRAKGYKLDNEFFDRANHSCTQCTNFTETFSYFEQLDNKDLKSFGEACDASCHKQPSEACPSWKPATTYPPVNTVVVNGVTMIKLPNGQLIPLPKQLEKAIAGGSMNSNLCAVCRNRTCTMKGLGEKVNGAIDDISGSLTTLLDAIEKTNATIRTTLGSITGEIKEIITKSGDKLKATVDTVACAPVGDVYNTIVISICADGLKGFSDYSWAFVYCAFFGVVLIGMTILLNMCVGLRPLDDNGAEKEFPDSRGRGGGGIEMSQPYADPPVHDAYVGGRPYVPTASAITYVPSPVPAVANAMPVTTNGAPASYSNKGGREAYLVHAS